MDGINGHRLRYWHAADAARAGLDPPYHEQARMRLTAAATVFVVLGALLAGCGTSTTTTVISSPAASSTTTGQASSSTTTTPQSSTATTTTATATGPRACVAADLTLSFLGQQGATGHGLLGFALRNHSAKSCKTFGYPGVLFLDKSGRPLPTVATRTTHDFFGPAPELNLVLAPGQRASFRLGVLHGVVPNVPCATAYALQVIPPDDTATLRTALDGGAYECKTATVSPLRPGRSAYP
jgi:hypothetical protein